MQWDGISGPSSIDKTSSVHDRYSTTPVKPDVKLYGLTFDSLNNASFLYAGLTLLAAISLVIEKCWNHLIC